MNRHLLPLGVFLLLAAFLAIGLNLNPREVPSPFIGKIAPAIDLPEMFNDGERVTSDSLKGRVWVLNVWASWCLECRREHGLFNEFASNSDVILVGLNYKDEDLDARRWLAELGNPYTLVAVDREGGTGIEWGVYGVPETFVIDKKGVVRYKHIGPIDAVSMREEIIPLISTLESES
jgi:cytochrome c biogenesis protein CcmG, thiol:disulfide interchange protein DsbE